MESSWEDNPHIAKTARGVVFERFICLASFQKVLQAPLESLPHS